MIAQPYDAETVDATPAPAGAPVDPPVRRTTFADLMLRTDERRPIVPASLRSRAGRHALAVWAVAAATHGALYHLTRAPKYAGKAIMWAPVGAWAVVWRPLRWASAEDGNHHLRQHAANVNDADTWLRLDARRMRQARARWALLVGLTAAAAVAAMLGWRAAPGWVHLVAAAAVLVALARLGRPADRPIVDRVFAGQRFVRLTAELTRAALVACGAGVKEPGAVRFNREIYRDGPGYTAEVTLPVGVIAPNVIDRRDYLAAGFQLPVAQVWPSPVLDAHPGVLGIWVADRPVDKMPQPASPLLDCGPLDFWGALPYGDDVRTRPVSWRLDERNSLFGGMPGSGKSLAARAVALAAALDPLVQFAVSELKGTGDFDPFERLCPDGLYVSGADQASKQRTMLILEWLDRECEVRGPLIRSLAARGLNTQNKVNRAMALAEPRLRPIVSIFDELQELLADPILGKAARAAIVSIVKRGRALGIHLILATQRIDKESAPKGLTSNVSTRCALAVPSHIETDLILGTGAYNRGARPTDFVPPAEGDNPWAGWGYLAGRAEPVRASYIDNPTAGLIIDRAEAMRDGTPTAGPGERIRMHNLAEDVRTVWPLGDDALWLERILPRLVELRPDVYGGWTVEQLGEALRRVGVPTKPMNRRISTDDTRRSTRVGVERRALDQAIAAAAGHSAIASSR